MTAISWFGDRAVVVSVPPTGRPVDVATDLAMVLSGTSVRPGMTSVLVEVPEPDPTLRAVVEAAFARIAARGEAMPDMSHVERGVVEIVVSYDGDDLESAAAALGCSPEELASAHQRQEWTVAMMGFAPGFGYLVPAGDAVVAWESVARREIPRARVPAGSVAVAAGMSAVYPADMPGGWHLLGTTTQWLFDPEDALRPALLAAGDTVRFRAAP